MFSILFYDKDIHSNTSVPTDTCLIICSHLYLKTCYIKEAAISPFNAPFTVRNILLEGKFLENLLRATLTENILQIGLTRLLGSACYLQVVIAKWNRLCLLTLEVEQVHCDLIQREDIMWSQGKKF